MESLSTPQRDHGAADQGCANHGWIGRGKVRAARLEGALLLRFHGLTTRGGKLQTPIAEFFRKDYRRLRPSFEPYAVTIWIECGPTTPKLDVDNVAKVCLDALTGAVWADDRQVVRLEVTKAAGPRGAITLLIRPETRSETTRLADLLARADALAKPAALAKPRDRGLGRPRGTPLGRP